MKNNINGWGIIMSIIQAVITDKICVISGDSRITNIQNGAYFSNFNKIIKLNNQIMFGVSGNPLDSFKLFEGYCRYHMKKGFQNTDDSIDILYNDFVNIISNKFSEMYDEHKTNKKRYNIEDIICGFNGNEFEIITLSLGSIIGLPDGMVKVHKKKDFPYKTVIAGLQEHKDKFQILAQKHYFENKKQLTIRQWKNIMQEVVDDGSKFDDTIDNNLNFETIRKIEKNGNIFYK
jgi:hypothetical protein